MYFSRCHPSTISQPWGDVEENLIHAWLFWKIPCHSALALSSHASLLRFEATWWGSKVNVSHCCLILIQLVVKFLCHSEVCNSRMLYISHDIKFKSNELSLSFWWIQSVYFFNDLQTSNINKFECFILLYNTNHSPKYQGHHWIWWALIKNVWKKKKSINIKWILKSSVGRENAQEVKPTVDGSRWNRMIMSWQKAFGALRGAEHASWEKVLVFRYL